MSKKRTLNDFFAPCTARESKTIKRLADDSVAASAHHSLHDSPARARALNPLHRDERCSVRSEHEVEEEEDDETTASGPASRHSSYPNAIAALPRSLDEQLSFCPFAAPRAINHRAKLDLLYFEPYIAPEAAQQLFYFLRRELPFYRVQYKIKRGSMETKITTPRYTSVFGVDDTCAFIARGDDGSSSKNDGNDGEERLVDAASSRQTSYRCTPRPIPSCLRRLKELVEGSTDSRFNFVLVNYYADGADSISYHSDDERFLGANPTIASLSLGTERDFYLKPKPSSPPAGGSTLTLQQPPAQQKHQQEEKQEKDAQQDPLKFKLSSGSMLLMRGPTQAHWLHSIPKRAGALVNSAHETGRINITFRRARVKAGTENYYRYNVLGDDDGGGAAAAAAGKVFRWDDSAGRMMLAK